MDSQVQVKFSTMSAICVSNNFAMEIIKYMHGTIQTKETRIPLFRDPQNTRITKTALYTGLSTAPN